MKRKGLLSFILLIMLNMPAFTSVSSFQKKAIPKAVLTGKVVDIRTGEVLPKVSVILENSKRKTETLTDPEGNFKIGVLEPGIYTLTVMGMNYKLDKKSIVINKKKQAVIINLRSLYNQTL